MSKEYIEQTRKHNERVDRQRHQQRSPLEYFEVRLTIIIAIIAVAIWLLT